MKARRIIILVAVLIGASWLLWAAIGKLESPSAFASLVEAHGLIPASLAPHIAWGVIVLECALAIAALWWTLGLNAANRALYAIGGIFVAFAFYAAALVFVPPPEPTSCGCSGVSAADASPADWRLLAIRNSVFAAGFFIAAWIATRPDLSEDNAEKPVTSAAIPEGA